MKTLADQLFKEFKEHSVSEFFRKNAAMLGYTGKIRSLTTVVHEGVTNSVSWNTPVAVKIDGVSRLVIIGELIDGLMEKYRDHVRVGNVESLHLSEDLKVLCFDKRTLKMKYKRVQSVHRHKLGVGEKLFLIRTVGGRKVIATKHHSLFTLSEERVVPVRVEELKKGDFIVVPKKWPERGHIKKLNLLEEILRLPPECTTNISLYGVKKLLYVNRELLGRIKALLDPRDRCYTFYAYHMARDRLPVDLLRQLSAEERKAFKGCEISWKNCRHKLPVMMDVDEDLMSILGLYSAEGCTRSNMQQVYFSFGSGERELAEYLTQAIARKFRIKASINQAHSSAINVVVSSKFAAFLFKYVFRGGGSAQDKKLPEIILNVTPELREKYLLSYIAGDGCPTALAFELMRNGGSLRDMNLKINACTTISQELFFGIQYLLASLGISFSTREIEKEERVVNGRLARFGKSYIIEVWGKQENSPLNLYPITAGGCEFYDAKIRYAVKNCGQGGIRFDVLDKLQREGGITMSAEALTFRNGDLAVLRISDIAEMDSAGCYVYDFSVDDDENFVGGFGPICLHNSIDAAEETGILPDVIVVIKRFNDNPEHLKVIIEDNASGIPEEFIPNVFGKMLAGTKLHRHMQARGQQGIGVSGAVMFGQITSGKPVAVTTSTGNGEIVHMEVMIDVDKNEGRVVNGYKAKGDWRGVRVELELKEVAYVRSRYGPFNYLRMTATANPHVRITLIEPDGALTVFERASEKVPERPKPIPLHPWGVMADDLLALAKHTKSRTVAGFLVAELSRVTKAKVDEISRISGVNLDKKPSELTWEDAEGIVAAFKRIRFMAPPTEGLRPIGAAEIKSGMRQVLQPEFVHAVTRSPKVYRGGLPFAVEVGVAYGGGAGKGTEEAEGGEETGGMELLRFANRAPLIFDQGGCVITAAVHSIDWRRYGVDITASPVSLFVHMVSAYVPYTSAGKQSIAEEPEVYEEIRAAIMEAARELRRFLFRKIRVKEKQERAGLFEQYLPVIAKKAASLAGVKEPDVRPLLKKIAGIEDAEES